MSSYYTVWKDFLYTVNTVVLTGYWKQLLPTLLIFLHIEHICSFFVAFFSATIDGRNLIFGHKLHICTPYSGQRFWTHQIPTSCRVEGFPVYCKYCCFDRILKTADYFLIWHIKFVSKWIRMWTLDQNKMNCELMLTYDNEKLCLWFCVE
jgi:hypothetical protein